MNTNKHDPTIITSNISNNKCKINIISVTPSLSGEDKGRLVIYDSNKKNQSIDLSDQKHKYQSMFINCKSNINISFFYYNKVAKKLNEEVFFIHHSVLITDIYYNEDIINNSIIDIYNTSSSSNSDNYKNTFTIEPFNYNIIKIKDLTKTHTISFTITHSDFSCISNENNNKTIYKSFFIANTEIIHEMKKNKADLVSVFSDSKCNWSQKECNRLVRKHKLNIIGNTINDIYITSGSHSVISTNINTCTNSNYSRKNNIANFIKKLINIKGGIELLSVYIEKGIIRDEDILGI
ncbi:hypothetical protein CDIK_1678 [Cucumispora dikerogammari]|nr:hypothetical protein CDIK_1678 [Cucumispora dikerogammari]